MNREQIDQFVTESGFESVAIFENPGYYRAFIGVTIDGAAVYSMEKMIGCLTGEMTREEAIEFIEYNTVRSLGYVDNPPVIIHEIEEA